MSLKFIIHSHTQLPATYLLFDLAYYLADGRLFIGIVGCWGVTREATAINPPFLPHLPVQVISSWLVILIIHFYINSLSRNSGSHLIYFEKKIIKQTKTNKQTKMKTIQKKRKETTKIKNNNKPKNNNNWKTKKNNSN